MKTIFTILMAVLFIAGSTAFAADIIIDENANIETGVTGSAKLEVTGSADEDAISGRAGGSGQSGVRGENTTAGNTGILGGHFGTYDAGVYGFGSPGYAGYFDGSVHATGDLFVSGILTGYTETDPQVGILTSGRWCKSDGLFIDCVVDPPLMIENDPQISNIDDGKWCKSDGSFVSCSYDAPGINETDPVFSGDPAAAVTGGDISNWDSAYSRGDHGAAGYDTSADSWSGTSDVTMITGNVGIGTASPGAKLDIEGASGAVTLLKLNQTGNYNWSGLRLYRDGVEKWLIGIPDTGDELYVKGLGGTRMVIDADGDVGIGITAPEVPLHVNGISLFELASGKIYLSTPMGRPGIIAFSSSNNRQDIIHFDDRMSLAASSSSSSPLLINALEVYSDGKTSVKTLETRSSLKFADGSSQTTAAAPTVLPQTPESNTITPIDTSGNTGQDTAMTLGPDGLPVIAYKNTTYGSLKVAKCYDQTCSAKTISTLSTGNTGLYPSIAIGTNGFPVISFYDSLNDELKLATCYDAECTPGNTTIVVIDFGGISPSRDYSSVAIGLDGMPVIAYHQAYFSNLNVIKCFTVDCDSQSNILTTIDSIGQVGKYPSIAIGVDGLPIIAYQDYGSNVLKTARCALPDCSSGAYLVTAPSSGGYNPSLTIGSDDMPVIAHYDVTNGALKLLKCNSFDCNAKVDRTVDTSGDAGQHPSITIGTDGFPVISYIESTVNQLLIAKCHDLECNSKTIQGITNAKSATALTLGPKGLPLIAYQDYGTSNLRFAGCANPYCLNNWAQR